MSEMAEKDSTTEQPKRKHVREPPSVPFLWELKPGIPKKDWKPEHSSPSVQLVLPLPAPVKLIASVPFSWEEKPGKPLPGFSTQAKNSSPSSSILPRHSHEYTPDIGAIDDETDIEPFGFDTDDSFSSAPSLLANCLVASSEISGAIPVDEFEYMNELMLTSLPGSPASESDGSTSSYMTGASSLVGASLLEKLFPLLPPDSGFLEKAVRNSDEVSCNLPEVKSKAFERNTSVVARKAPTLGELIMMSRRRSYMRKTELNDRNLQRIELQDAAFLCRASN